MPRSPLLTLAMISFAGCATEPTPTPRGPEVQVTFEADKPAATLESRFADDWKVVCTSPCIESVRPDRLYRVSGEGITTSNAFVVSRPTAISARTGSNSAHSTGVVLVAVGTPMMIVGGLLTLGLMLGGGGHGVDGLEEALWGSGAVFVGGTAMTVGGAWMLRSSNTAVDLRERSPIAKLTFKF